MPLVPVIQPVIPKWGLFIFGGYELLQSLLLHGLVKYLSSQGSQYRYDKGGQVDKVKYSKAETAEDSHGDISVTQTNAEWTCQE